MRPAANNAIRWIVNTQTSTIKNKCIKKKKILMMEKSAWLSEIFRDLLLDLTHFTKPVFALGILYYFHIIFDYDTTKGHSQCMGLFHLRNDAIFQYAFSYSFPSRNSKFRHRNTNNKGGLRWYARFQRKIGSNKSSIIMTFNFWLWFSPSRCLGELQSLSWSSRKRWQDLCSSFFFPSRWPSLRIYFFRNHNIHEAN